MPQKAQLLAAWYRKANRELLTRFLDEHPTWAESAWPVQLRQLVDGGRFEAAVRRAAEHYQVSLDLPATVDEPHADSPTAPTDNPVAEFKAAWRQGNMITARRVLDEAAKVPRPVADPEFLRLRAALAAHDADWPAAWQALDRYLQQTHAGEYVL